jgi:hypothetical protein
MLEKTLNFSRLLQQITTNVVAQNNRNLLSHRSEPWKSKSRCGQSSAYGSSRGQSFTCFSKPLVLASSIPRLVASSLSALSSHSLFLCMSLIRMLSLALGPSRII